MANHYVICHVSIYGIYGICHMSYVIICHMSCQIICHMSICRQYVICHMSCHMSCHVRPYLDVYTNMMQQTGQQPGMFPPFLSWPRSRSHFHLGCESRKRSKVLQPTLQSKSQSRLLCTVWHGTWSRLRNSCKLSESGPWAMPWLPCPWEIKKTICPTINPKAEKCSNWNMICVSDSPFLTITSDSALPIYNISTLPAISNPSMLWSGALSLSMSTCVTCMCPLEGSLFSFPRNPT